MPMRRYESAIASPPARGFRIAAIISIPRWAWTGMDVSGARVRPPKRSSHRARFAPQAGLVPSTPRGVRRLKPKGKKTRRECRTVRAAQFVDEGGGEQIRLRGIRACIRCKQPRHIAERRLREAGDDQAEAIANSPSRIDRHGHAFMEPARGRASAGAGAQREMSVTWTRGGSASPPCCSASARMCASRLRIQCAAGSSEAGATTVSAPFGSSRSGGERQAEQQERSGH